MAGSFALFYHFFKTGLHLESGTLEQLKSYGLYGLEFNPDLYTRDFSGPCRYIHAYHPSMKMETGSSRGESAKSHPIIPKVSAKS